MLQKNAQVIVNMEEIQVKENKEMQDPIPAKQINMGFGGTLIAYGRATMVVTSTGDNTEMGKIAQTLQIDEEETPLQRKLGDLGKTITKNIKRYSRFAIYIYGYQNDSIW